MRIKQPIWIKLYPYSNKANNYKAIVRNYLLYILPLFVGISLATCDKKEPDVVPDSHFHLSLKDDQVSSLTDTSLSLDLLDNDEIRGAFQMRWIRSSDLGIDFQGVKSNRYHFRIGAEAGHDTMTYVICNERFCDTAQVLFHILPRPYEPTPTDSQDVCKPQIRNDYYTLSTNKSLTLEPKLNDSLCGSAEMVILNQPHHGEISSVDLFYPIDYQAHTLRKPFRDSIQYMMCDGGVCDTATIYIDFDPNCARYFKAVNDTILLGINHKNILLDRRFFLLNDQYCASHIDSSSFRITKKPIMGNLLNHDQGLYQYTHAQTQAFSDVFEYEICNKDHSTCYRTSVYIEVKPFVVENSTYLDWLHD